MSPSLRLISTDFDGTVFAEFETPPIPAKLVSLIAELQAKGARWVVNTGRDLSGLMEALGRAHVPIQPDYLVLVEREIYVHGGTQYTGVAEWNDTCANAHTLLFDKVRAEVPGLAESIGAHHRATIYADTFSPFCVIAANNGEADAIQFHLERFARQVSGLAVVRNDVYMRFSHADYNKGTALVEIRRRLGVSSEETFAIGDHLNDLPMLERHRAEWIAAPVNAVDAVRHRILDESGYLSRFPSGDGVADALEWCLRQIDRRA